MKKKRKLKKKVVVFIVLFIILIILLTGLIIYKSMSKETTTNKVVDSISEYGYSLESDQPKIYKNLFKELVETLNKEDVDYKEYASLISQMFVLDFYNLDNKTSKNDVGGTQFVYKDNINNFTLKASDTVYKYIKNNFDGKRNQELPKVKSVTLKQIENKEYKYDKIEDKESFVCEVSLTYEEDLGYEEDVTVTLIHNDKKLEVCEME